MKRFFLSLASVLLAACLPAFTPPQPAPERFDLGAAPVFSGTKAPPVSARGMEFHLFSAPALENSFMRYRLTYADPAKVQFYAYARWAGAPGDILRSFLQERLFWAEDAEPDICRLELELQRFEQVFTTPEKSFGALLVQARLRHPDTGVKAERRIDVSIAAPAPDAASGVKALTEAAGRLAGELLRWRAGSGANCRQ
ncbi:MAG: ABC-type transport auxiliary lipoprotein family protein [Zoogloeaceae bacterium]|jgi:cholesterol transport system auxiliary component|nr:ABC-type transport auxiliary lipoprotein family protein [Zoogloeaceae bacterium]